MSRQEDVAYLKGELARLEAEAKQLQVTFQKYEADVVSAIKEILVAAGVWDEVHALDTEKAEAAKRAQARLQEIQAKGQELVRVLNFLLSREQEIAPAPPVTVDPPTPEQAPKDSMTVAKVAELLGAIPKKHPTPPI